jgi:hypothetical protein
MRRRRWQLWYSRNGFRGDSTAFTPTYFMHIYDAFILIYGKAWV